MTFKQFKAIYQKVPVIEYPNEVPYQKAKLTVKVITYNHAKYIGQCLDNILMQQTNFDFYILLGEDASSDGTRDICIDYAKRYPTKIRLLLHERINNIPLKGRPSGIFNSTYCNYLIETDYVAFCEGDDFWGDPTALQQQIDFLDQHSNYSFCFYDAKWINTSDEIIRPSSLSVKEKRYPDRSMTDLLAKCTIPNLTKVYRNNLITIFDEGMEDIMCGDILQLCKLGQFGKGKYIDSIKPAIYRVHSGGIYSQLSILQMLQNIIEVLNFLLHHQKIPHSSAVHARLAHCYWKKFFFTIWLEQRIDTTLINQAKRHSSLANEYSFKMIGKVLKEIVERKIERIYNARLLVAKS